MLNMSYTQKFGRIFPTIIEVKLQETGFDYKITQKNFGGDSIKSLFFGYEEILNNRNTENFTREPVRNVFIVSAVLVFIGILSFVINFSEPGITKPKILTLIETHDALFTWGTILLFYILYKIIVTKKMVRFETSRGGYFSLFKNAESEKIISEIINRRNAYIKKRYLEDKFAKENLNIETIDWLSAMEVISKEESVKLTETLKNKENKADLGFITNEKK